MADMLDELAPTLEARAESRPFVLVSMAAGLSMQQIRHMAGQRATPIIRMMPNTPVALGAGMIQYCCDDVEPAQTAGMAGRPCSPHGRLDEVPETLIDARQRSFSGCGPAWVVPSFIEATGRWRRGRRPAPRQGPGICRPDGAGAAPAWCWKAAATPGALKDAVCSPGGSTIQGVRLLEERAFRGAVTDAPCWPPTRKRKSWESKMRIVVKVGTSTLAHPGGRLKHSPYRGPCQGMERHQKRRT